MKRKILHYTKIAEIIGKPPSTVHRWLSGVRGISPTVAYELEKATGIKAEAWIFPEKYRNPYLKESFN
jgi:plasmid maintenance system antidote protein VapI